MNAPPRFALAQQSAGPVPLRRAGSVRRTTSIDSHWPDGYGNAYVLIGAGRDIVTPAAGASPIEAASGGFTITASPQREILAITTTPCHMHEQELVGVRAGGASRAALGALMGDIRGSPLFQLLDDFAGASLVAPWIWSEWTADWAADRREATANAGHAARMENICTGFAAGSTALTATGQANHDLQSRTEVGPLENEDDPGGWHPLGVQTGAQGRRARWIDLHRNGEMLRVDAGFQDSCSNPHGGRTAVHEYRIDAEIDPKTMRLAAIRARPLILPYAECPGAALNVGRLVGHEVSTLREGVPSTLPGALGCTHLNDVIRALADVPVLAGFLPVEAARIRRGTNGDVLRDQSNSKE